jgi:hypothetical protein
MVMQLTLFRSTPRRLNSLPTGISSILLSLSLGLVGSASPATAEPGPWLSPVSSVSPLQNGRSLPQSHPVRGCEGAEPIRLTLITPPEHAATTLSAHPTLLWQVTGPSDAPLQFTLMAPGSRQPLYQQTLKAEQAGVIAVTLPDESAALELGQQYRWTVSLICDADRPSQNVYARAWVTRVAPSTHLALQLLGIQPGPEAEQQRALAYATAGVWYDVAASLNQAQNFTQNRLLADALQAQLDKIGLPPLAIK